MASARALSSAASAHPWRWCHPGVRNAQTYERATGECACERGLGGGALTSQGCGERGLHATLSRSTRLKISRNSASSSFVKCACFCSFSAIEPTAKAASAQHRASRRSRQQRRRRGHVPPSNRGGGRSKRLGALKKGFSLSKRPTALSQPAVVWLLLFPSETALLTSGYYSYGIKILISEIRHRSLETTTTRRALLLLRTPQHPKVGPADRTGPRTRSPRARNSG